jgi:hypothetical protein
MHSPITIPLSSGIDMHLKNMPVRGEYGGISLQHNQKKTEKTMKATIFLAAVVLTLQVNALLAASDGAAIKSDANTPVTISLAPVTPASAPFEETNIFSISDLSPVTPPAADFSDASTQPDVKKTVLSPSSPSMAGFDDNDEAQIGNTTTLGPTTPASADFDEPVPFEKR